MPGGLGIYIYRSNTTRVTPHSRRLSFDLALSAFKVKVKVSFFVYAYGCMRYIARALARSTPHCPHKKVSRPPAQATMEGPSLRGRSLLGFEPRARRY
jgi:hypothetical protein